MATCNRKWEQKIQKKSTVATVAEEKYKKRPFPANTYWFVFKLNPKIIFSCVRAHRRMCVCGIFWCSASIFFGFDLIESKSYRKFHIQRGTCLLRSIYMHYFFFPARNRGWLLRVISTDKKKTLLFPYALLFVRIFYRFFLSLVLVILLGTCIPFKVEPDMIFIRLMLDSSTVESKHSTYAL